MSLSLERKIALCYIVPRATPFIAKDILIMKKVNLVLQKLDLTNKDIYVLETFNLIKTLSNIFYLDKLYLILCEFVDIEYHTTLAFLIQESKASESRNIINKLKDLVKE